MKIAINGTSRGLGKYLTDVLSSYGEIVVVRSRLPDYESIINEVRDCDVFINNVHERFFQVELLHALYRAWRLLDRHVVCIGSRAVNQNASVNSEYASAKVALQSAVDNYIIKDREKKCKLTVLNPGLIQKIEGYSLGYEDVAFVVKYVLSCPGHLEISRLDFHHRVAYSHVQSLKSQLYGSKFK